MSPAFLMDMMEQREALADARAARDLAEVTKLGAAIAQRAKGVEAKLTDTFAAPTPDLSRISLLGAHSLPSLSNGSYMSMISRAHFSLSMTRWPAGWLLLHSSRFSGRLSARSPFL